MVIKLMDFEYFAVAPSLFNVLMQGGGGGWSAQWMETAGPLEELGYAVTYTYEPHPPSELSCLHRCVSILREDGTLPENNSILLKQYGACWDDDPVRGYVQLQMDINADKARWREECRSAAKAMMEALCERKY